MVKLIDDIVNTARAYTENFKTLGDLDYSIESLKLVDEHLDIATIYKTSNMESYKYQDYSEPIDSDLAYQLTHPQEDDVDANSEGNYWDGGGNE